MPEDEAAESESSSCPVCMEPFINEQSKCVTRCGHVICSACITKLRTPHCPLCRTPMWGPAASDGEAQERERQIEADRRYAASLQGGSVDSHQEDRHVGSGSVVPLPFLHLPQQRAMTYSSFSR